MGKRDVFTPLFDQLRADLSGADHITACVVLEALEKSHDLWMAWPDDDDPGRHACKIPEHVVKSWDLAMQRLETL